MLEARLVQEEKLVDLKSQTEEQDNLPVTDQVESPGENS